jgi:C-terminal processing protease CtpA/Prc
MSNVAVEFANGTKTQQIGIQPDIKVEGESNKDNDQILETVLKSLN